MTIQTEQPITVARTPRKIVIAIVLVVMLTISGVIALFALTQTPAVAITIVIVA